MASLPIASCLVIEKILFLELAPVFTIVPRGESTFVKKFIIGSVM